MSALDWLMQQLGGGDQQPATAARQTDPRDLAAAFDKMTGPAADQAYWDAQRERYGSAPPDRAGGDPQVGPGLPQGKQAMGDHGVYGGSPMAFPQGLLPQHEGPSAVLPPEGMGWPTLPPAMNHGPPRDFTFDDQPFADSNYRRRNPASDPWAMLKVAPLNQMFRQYADPWAFPEEAIPAALKARRRIPGLY